MKMGYIVPDVPSFGTSGTPGQNLPRLPEKWSRYTFSAELIDVDIIFFIFLLVAGGSYDFFQVFYYFFIIVTTFGDQVCQRHIHKGHNCPACQAKYSHHGQFVPFMDFL